MKSIKIQDRGGEREIYISCFAAARKCFLLSSRMKWPGVYTSVDEILIFI